MLNLVEMVSGEEEQEEAPCKFGNIITDHACYCHNPKSGYGKCPIWRNGEEWNKENCPVFSKRKTPNQSLK